MGGGHRGLDICCTRETAYELPAFEKPVSPRKRNTSGARLVLRCQSSRMWEWALVAWRDVYASKVNNIYFKQQFNGLTVITLHGADLQQNNWVNKRDPNIPQVWIIAK